MLVKIKSNEASPLVGLFTSRERPKQLITDSQKKSLIVSGCHGATRFQLTFGGLTTPSKRILDDGGNFCSDWTSQVR